MTSVTAVARSLNQVLRAAPAEHARVSGFCRRRSKLSAAVFVQTLVLGWLANPGASLTELSMVAAERGVAITPQGLDQRFGPRAAALLEGVLAETVRQSVTANPLMTTALAGFSAVLVLDSTTIRLPDELAELWAGCGGRVAHQGLAAVKATLQLDLRGGGLAGPELSPARRQDRSSALLRAPLPTGALRIADLGFSSLGVFREIAEQHAFFLSRLHPQLRLSPAGATTPLALEAWLAAQAGDEVEALVELGRQARLPVRLLALRVPAEVAETRAVGIRERARISGAPPNPTALARVDWQLAVTNAPPERLSLRNAVAVMRARWQIELLFKRWKSQGKLDEWRTRHPDRVRCEVCAKLIALLITHWLLVVGVWAQPDRSLTRATGVIQTHALMIARALDRPRALRDELVRLVRVLACTPRITKRRRPNSAQVLANPALATLA